MRTSHTGEVGILMLSLIFEEEEEDLDDNLTTDHMATKLDKGKLYSCLALQPFKGKGAKGKESYLFAISKAEQVFDYLVKDLQIWLL